MGLKALVDLKALVGLKTESPVCKICSITLYDGEMCSTCESKHLLDSYGLKISQLRLKATAIHIKIGNFSGRMIDLSQLEKEEHNCYVAIAEIEEKIHWIQKYLPEPIALAEEFGEVLNGLGMA